MNSSSPQKKRGKTDKEINLVIKLLFFMLFFISMGISLASGKIVGYFGLVFMVRTLVSLSDIIPISLKVNSELAKFYYAYQI